MLLYKFYQKKLIIPFVNQLRKGISPRRLAASTSIAFFFGIMPLFGITPFLTGAFVLRLRLNMIVAQIVNIIVAPLQFILLVPFLRMGQYFAGAQRKIEITLSELPTIMRNDFQSFLNIFWHAELMAIIAWFIITVPFGVLLYFISNKVYRRLVHRFGRDVAPQV